MSLPPPDWTAARDVLGKDGLLSVVLPAYNLGGVILQNLRRLGAVFRGNVAFELVPVDDGSVDDTAARIREAAAELPEVHPVFLEVNQGKGEALRQGTAAARGSHILLLDADLDLPPEPTAHFFEIMRDRGADIVIGSKMHPESVVDYPWRRRLASRVYYGLVKLLIGLPVHDTQTGMKLFKAAALRMAFDRQLCKRFAFDTEVLAIAHAHGHRIAEAPIEMSFGNKMGCLTATNVRQTLHDTLAIFYRLRILRYYSTLRDPAYPAPLPRVSAVVACPAPSDYLDHCVAGLLAQNYPGLEILVLPDAPTGRAWPAGVREIPTGPVRPAEKRNLGIEKATGEIVAFVDDDAAPLPGWLMRALRYFGDPRVAGVGGPAVTPPDDPYLAQIGGRVFANPLVAGPFRRRYTPTRVCEEDDIPSCNLLVRTSVLRQIGGYDTRHWPGEDTLLCQTITRDLGLSLVYDPWVVVTHHRRPLFGPHLRQLGRYALHRGAFARKFGGTSRKFGYLVPSLLVVGTIGTALCLYVALIDFAPTAEVSILQMVSPAMSVMACIGLAVLALYLALVLAFSVAIPRVDVWLLTAAGVVASHYCYGIRFLQGLLGGALPKAKARAFDHPSERAASRPAAADKEPSP